MSSRPDPLLAKLTVEDIEKAVAETGLLLAAARARGDVVLLDYQSEYLKSKLWVKTIKPRILKRDGGICRSCGCPGDDVHHRTYDRDILEGANDAMLVTVCRWCHEIIHFDEDGARRPQADTDAILFASKPTQIPEPEVDMRRTSLGQPPSKPRMTGFQRALWFARARELWTERREQLDQAQQKRDAAKPPAVVPSLTWAEQREWRRK